MQGLADGYFILPYTIGDYIARTPHDQLSDDTAEFQETESDARARIHRLHTAAGKRTSTSFHRELGKLMSDACGMSRSKDGLLDALERIPTLREEFYRDVAAPGKTENVNIALEQAGRVADFLEFAEVMCHDALARDESCGAHFRVEHQTSQGEAERNDDEYCNVSAWAFTGVDCRPVLHTEPLNLETVTLAERNYK